MSTSKLKEIKKVLKKDFTILKRKGLPVIDGRGNTHLTASKFRSFSMCPQKYYFQYIEKLPFPCIPKIEFGSAMHETLQYNDEFIIKNGKSLSVEKVQEVFELLWKDKQEGMLYDKNNTLDNCETYLQDGFDVVENYMKKFVRKTSPIATEIKFDIVHEGLHIVGYIDKNDNGVLVDRKVGSAYYTQGDVTDNMQLTIYSLGYRISTGELEDGVAIEQLYKSTAKDYEKRRKGHKVRVIMSGRVSDQHNRAIYALKKMRDSIQSGIFVPVFDPKVCMYCAYKDECFSQCKHISTPKFIE